MSGLIASFSRPFSGLRQWLGKSKKTPRAQFEQSDLSLDLAKDTVPVSLLPKDTDEVLAAGFKDAQTEIARILGACGCCVVKTEIRRRLSVREYRAYITINTSMGIDRLYELEPLMRTKVLRENCIEIRDFFWTFTPTKVDVV